MRSAKPLQLSFNASLKVDFQGSRVTSDGGLILIRELDECLGFGELIAQHLADSRRTRNSRWRACSASPSTAASRAMRMAMRMSTTPSGSHKIRRSA